MIEARAATPDTLLRRLWTYQAERFPLAKTATLLAAFSAASVNVSAFLGGRSLPGLGSYLAVFMVSLIVFFQLRACDEVKDAEDDRRYRPERPIPRGLVSQQMIVGIGLALMPVAIVAALSLSPRMLLPLSAIWVWLALMTVEFGVPEWLKARPMLYLISHMLIMPLIDLFVTAADWLVRAGAPPPALWLFLALSFVNGCVLEIGRKLYAPQNERVGVETYTGLMGVKAASRLWALCLAASLALLIWIGFAVSAPKAVAAAGAAAFVSVIAVAVRFARQPDTKAQKAVDMAAGLWVFVCYMTAGFLPLLGRGT